MISPTLWVLSTTKNVGGSLVKKNIMILNKRFNSTNNNSNDPAQYKLKINSTLDNIVFVDNKSILLISPLRSFLTICEMIETYNNKISSSDYVNEDESTFSH